MRIKHLLLLTLLVCLNIQAKTKNQQTTWNSPQAGNPIIPGYFADPTVRKFGDTYYIYATTDGNGGGLGPSQVWVSKDFVNWTIMPMNWPTTYHIWAPDVMKGKDGKFYMYYCEPCKVYTGVSETPRGPWKNYLGNDTTVLVPDRFVKNVITLDGQSFVDDDGSTYLYWGTWGIYKDFGCGVGKLTSDLKGFSEKKIIPNTQATDFFEAPFMIKKDGIYYFTYSSGHCEDHTYRVQYATSKTGPMGPFVYAKNNPILATNADSTIHGPGHHSILQEGDNYYIVYHRHNIPCSTRGMHRQIAVDKLIFTKDGQIEKVAAGHNGIGYLQPSTNPFPNVALGKKVKASSYYGESFKPEYALDDNNATLWRPRTSGKEWIEVDLGKEYDICRIWTQFEYPTSYYQYMIETSVDGKQWIVFADKHNNKLAGSPMTDFGKARARYVKLTVTGSEKTGMIGAIWNIKVFEGSKIDPPQKLVQITPSSFVKKVCDKTNKEYNCWENNNGMLAGSFIENGDITLIEKGGRGAIHIPANSRLESTFTMPQSFYMSQPYTISYRVYGTMKEALKQIVCWDSKQPKSLASVNNKDSKASAWHYVSLTSDGKKESVYMDSVLVSSCKATKTSKKCQKLVIEGGENGVIISDLRIYNWQLALPEIMFDASLQDEAPVKTVSINKEMLVDINADNYMSGVSLRQIENGQGIKGGFRSLASPVSVERKNNRLAFAFNGTQEFQSSFQVPESFSDNTPYSITAWVLNPEVEVNECIIDLIPAQGELEKIAFGWGTEPRNGVICHNGWFEDSGNPELKGMGEWKHIAITYDGYMEKIFIDGKLAKQKDIVLRLPRSPYVTLGRTAEHEWPFAGWLHSLKVYNYTLNEADITTEFASDKPKVD